MGVRSQIQETFVPGTDKTSNDRVTRDLLTGRVLSLRYLVATNLLFTWMFMNSVRSKLTKIDEGHYISPIFINFDKTTTRFPSNLSIAPSVDCSQYEQVLHRALDTSSVSSYVRVCGGKRTTSLELFSGRKYRQRRDFCCGRSILRPS